MKTKKIVALVFVLAIAFVNFNFQIENVSAQDNYTKLLIHSDDLDESTSFVDSSANGYTITANGTVNHEVDEAKFGASSIEFPGGAQYLTVPDSDDWNFGSGDFTIDFWINFSSFPTNDWVGLVSQYPNANVVWSVYWDSRFSQQKMKFWANGGSGIFVFDEDNTGQWSIDQWYHVALVRSSDDWYMFRNGEIIGSKTETATMPDVSSSLRINGEDNVSGKDFNGYMDEIRISKGIARWTSDFSDCLPPFAWGSGDYKCDDVGIGVDVAEVVSLDCGTDVDFGTITPGTPVSASTDCTVTTNAENGYTLQVKRDDADTTMDHTTDDTSNITDKTAWTGTGGTTETWTGTGLGFAVYTSTTGSKNTTDWGAGTACHDALNEYTGFPSAYQSILSHSSYSGTSTTTGICYRVDTPSTQKSGAYDGTITYQVYTNP